MSTLAAAGTSQAARWGCRALLAVLLLYAAAGALVSLVPASILIAQLSGLAGSGDAASLVVQRYAALVLRARVTSAVLLALWMILLLYRNSLARLIGRLAAALNDGLRSMPANARAAMRRAWTQHRAETLMFLLILLAGTTLRLAYLDRDIRHDEAWTYMVYGRRPLILAPLVLTDVNHHPLNTILIHLTTFLFGSSLPAIRLPAFLFGVACIPAGYALVRAVWGVGAALLAGAFIAGASPLIEFSVNARGYSAVTCCALILLWAGERALRRPGPWAWSIAVLAGIAGTYANIVMILPCVAAFTWFGLLSLASAAPLRWTRLRQVFSAGSALVAGALFLYVPFFTVSGWDAITGSQGIKARAGALDAIREVPGFITGLLADWGRDLWPGLGLALAVAAIASFVLARRNRLDCAALLLGIAAVFAFQFAVVRDSGPFRVWLPMLPILLALAAAAIDGVLALATPRLAMPAALALVLLAAGPLAVARGRSLRTSIETGYFPAAQEAAGDLAGMASPDLLAITAVRGDDVAYYAMRHGLRIEPVTTGPTLRLFRPAGTTTRPGPGTLTVIVDKKLDFCTVSVCLAEAAALVPTASAPAIVKNNDDYTELRAPRRDP